MGAEDWPAVARIFEQGIATGNATFERAAPSCVWLHEMGRA
jgi:L-amino acid N-acyltransferase YncA